MSADNATPSDPKALSISDAKRAFGQLLTCGIDEDFLKDTQLVVAALGGRDYRNFHVLWHYVIPEEGHRGTLTARQYQDARERFLAAVTQATNNASGDASRHTLKHALILMNVLSELRERALHSDMAVCELPFPTDRQRVASTNDAHGGESFNDIIFMGKLSKPEELPDEVRYQLTPEHRKILADGAKTLREFQELVQRALEQYKNVDPETLDDETKKTVEVARRLLTKLGTGVTLPFGSGERQLPSGH